METETAATERRRRGWKRSDARRGCAPEKRKRPSDPVGFGDELGDDAGDTLAEMDETLLTEDERAYREARRRAELGRVAAEALEDRRRSLDVVHGLHTRAPPALVRRLAPARREESAHSGVARVRPAQQVHAPVIAWSHVH